MNALLVTILLSSNFTIQDIHALDQVCSPVTGERKARCYYDLGVAFGDHGCFTESSFLMRRAHRFSRSVRKHILMYNAAKMGYRAYKSEGASICNAIELLELYLALYPEEDDKLEILLWLEELLTTYEAELCTIS